MQRSVHRSAAVAAAKSAVGLLITAVLGAAMLLDVGVLLAGSGGTGGQSSRAPGPGTTATVTSSDGRGAGVRAAQCMRAHGLPTVSDPTAQTPYAPGHGFGFTCSELPPGDKFNPAFRRAAQACQAVLDAVDRASTLQSLGTDG